MSIGSKDHEYENYFEYLDYLELIESRAKGNGGCTKQKMTSMFVPKSTPEAGHVSIEREGEV